MRIWSSDGRPKGFRTEQSAIENFPWYVRWKLSVGYTQYIFRFTWEEEKEVSTEGYTVTENSCVKNAYWEILCAIYI